MLISHQHQFIFTKTFKTGGTSIERYFEPYCLSPNELRVRDGEHIGENGIIGKRGNRDPHTIWYNHMPALSVKERLGAEKWDSYFKFSIIRNPFDQMVSAYFFLLHLKNQLSRFERRKRELKVIFGRKEYLLPGNHPDTITNFRQWITSGAIFNDTPAYTIDGEVCVDYLIRYESLEHGMREVCEKIQVSFEPERLPHDKAMHRISKPTLQEMYDEKTRALVSQRFNWVLAKFGYTFPEN